MRARIVEEDRGIPWSKKDVTRMPVVGVAYTRELRFRADDGEWITYPGTEMEVVERAGDVYVCNTWYKPGVPQAVHRDMVERFEPRGIDEEAQVPFSNANRNGPINGTYPLGRMRYEGSDKPEPGTTKTYRKLEAENHHGYRFQYFRYFNSDEDFFQTANRGIEVPYMTDEECEKATATSRSEAEFSKAQSRRY